MRIKDLQNIFHIELDAIYNKEEVDSFFFMLTKAFYNVNRLQLALNPTITITKAEQEPIFNALDDLVHGKPIQYIIGETEFYGLNFKVNSSVLIPRPETEELVNWIISINKKKDCLKILDIGTGSGCVAIALAKNLHNANIYALDVCLDALEVAKENAKLNGVHVKFLHQDILDQNVKINDVKFDIIVSNPPYVRKLEKEIMKANVVEHEPHLALFVKDNDALQFYKAITSFAIENLNKNGILFFEINEYLGEEMKVLLKELRFNSIELKKDIFNKDRMIKACI